MILSIISPIAINWERQKVFLGKYGDYLSLQHNPVSLADLKVYGDKVSNEIDVQFDPLNKSYVYFIKLAYLDSQSNSVIRPGLQCGEILIIDKTKILINDDMAEIVDDSYEYSAEEHFRIICGILELLNDKKMTNILDKLIKYFK